MVDEALAIVREYIDSHIDHTDYTLFVVWQSTALQHFKCLITATVLFGMCFDLTCDGDSRCWYFNAYRKVDQQEIPHGVQ